MSHPGVLLSAFLDGELTSAERLEVTSHLTGCGDCRAELADLDAARVAVRSLPLLDPPPVLLPENVVELDRSRPALPRAWWARAGAAAAAAVLVVAIGLAAFGGGSAPSVDLGSVIDQHAARVSVDPGLTSVRLVSVVNQP